MSAPRAAAPPSAANAPSSSTASSANTNTSIIEVTIKRSLENILKLIKGNKKFNNIRDACNVALELEK